MHKTVFFAFNGEVLYLFHVLLNALDMQARGWDVRVVIEGAAAKLIPEMTKEGSPLHGSFRKTRQRNIIDGVCKACATKMGTLEAAKAEGLALLEDLSGHPGMARYREQGYEIIMA